MGCTTFGLTGSLKCKQKKLAESTAAFFNITRNLHVANSLDLKAGSTYLCYISFQSPAQQAQQQHSVEPEGILLTPNFTYLS